MSQLDILNVLEKSGGLERNDLFNKVKHLFNKSSFEVNIKKLLRQNEIMQSERIKYNMGVKKTIIKYFICNC